MVSLLKWGKKDKVKHFIVGAALSIFCASLALINLPAFLLWVPTFWGTLALVGCIAMAKEIKDKMGHGTPEVLDVVATVVPVPIVYTLLTLM